MKRQINLYVVLLLLGSTFSAKAQNEDESKIKVEITKEINGEKRTFKGEYENEEQMYADPNYREFAGEENDFSIWFDGDSESNIKLWVDRLKDDSQSIFKFDLDQNDSTSFFFNTFDDSSDFLQIHDWVSHDLKKHLNGLDINLDQLIGQLQDGSLGVTDTRKIRVTELEEGDFGKIGKVSKNEELILTNLSFSPNPSQEKVNVRFEVPSEDELTLKVYNENKREVFSRNFERFGGTYSESLDLSHQQEGIYLLEITLGKKRLTRKIMIN